MTIQSQINSFPLDTMKQALANTEVSHFYEEYINFIKI